MKSSALDPGASKQEGETTSPNKGEVTRWLIAGTDGDAHALESLLPLVYEELHRQAVAFFRREHAGHTLKAASTLHGGFLLGQAVADVRFGDRGIAGVEGTIGVYV